MAQSRFVAVLLISVAIVGLLTIVVISYRQTIPAYPNGSGSYIVAKDNLGTLPDLIAAASLLIDYVLTDYRIGTLRNGSHVLINADVSLLHKLPV